MRVRSLGPDDMRLAAVGGGDFSLARAVARGVDVDEARRALFKAIDAAPMVIDVADEDDAERAVGEAVRTLRARDRIVVATQVPALAVAERLADRLDQRLPAAYVQQRVEASLRATRLDALPLAQLAIEPGWLRSPAWPELRATCVRLQREGKVVRWGARVDRGFEPMEMAAPPPPPAKGLVLVASLEDAVAELTAPPPAAAPVVRSPASALCDEDWLAALSVPFNLCERAAEPLLAQPRVVVLARRPLAGGALAGKLGTAVRLPPTDDRAALDAATLARIDRGTARLARLVHHEAESLGELALRYVIDRGALALPRLHRRIHVDDALRAGSAPPLSTPERIISTLDET